MTNVPIPIIIEISKYYVLLNTSGVSGISRVIIYISCLNWFRFSRTILDNVTTKYKY